ncbi:SWIM zinc finger family protein [Rhodopirellula maiorica SM1]|uniref:SWIM zinc finger family protein n=1 Tax=Rhodopirellula maiorica SM1 TaxID=1265738 RepID=M5RAF0_9BACT|nr:SWIM zinc finger family protein [Rhodopirellula maiorica]EMI16335.1 SWIM zinc finger family protein [Rhodopirellula maiorica SM1]
MTRVDLLSLSTDDLASLTNRGTVKRAQRELDEGQYSYEINEPDDDDDNNDDAAVHDLIVTWSDGTVCQFVSGQTIHEAKCSSGSIGISRHIVRSVLAYQRHVANNVAADQAETSEDRGDATAVHEDTATRSTTAAWDPGQIRDEDLIQHFPKATITRARKVFDDGVLVELTRGEKPTARFLHESCTVRFPVPGDARYARADCAATMLPHWTAMAVWAFRELDPKRNAGLMSVGQNELPVPHDELDRLDELVIELCSDGISGCSPTWPQRLSRLEKQLRRCGLVWPAELVLQLIHQYERYIQKDARFSPTETVRLIGELIARSRSIRSQNGSVPQPLVRGNKSDRRTDIKAGRLVGLGLGVRPGRSQTKMLAYFQDIDTGTVVAVQRVFADPDPKSQTTTKSYADLAAHSLSRGVSLGGAAMSQMMLGSGKRTATDELILPRTSGKLTTNPQSFQWEQLQPPLAIEHFQQARERFELLPPDWLRPLRYTENLHVLSVTRISDSHFDVVHQQLTATMHDALGETARIIFPYHHRGDAGFTQLQHMLATRSGDARFVCGHVRWLHQQLEIEPISIVFQSADGTRQAISTWIGGGGETAQADAKSADTPPSSPQSTIKDFLSTLNIQLSEILLTGLAQTAPQDWLALSEAAQRLGFVRLNQPIYELSEELAKRMDQVRWNPSLAARTTAQLCMFSRLLE